MKQTIEIEVPDGKKAVLKDGKVVFEDIKPQLPKTWEDFCKQNRIKDGECFLYSDSEIIKLIDFDREEYIDRNVLPNIQAAKAHLALNIYAHNEDIQPLREYLLKIRDIKIDAFIISDPGIICLVRDKSIPFIGFPIAVKKFDVIGCTKFKKVKNKKILK